MREILFRGKRLDNGEWVEGSLVYVNNGETLERHPCIVISYNHDTFDWFEVIPETVSQFTGLTDKNGDKIFEGDKVIFLATTCNFIPKGNGCNPYVKNSIFYVKRLDSGFSLIEEELKEIISPSQVGVVDNYFFWNNQRAFEIIGNIHDK